ncbi:uncharacterized protein PGTG_05758, partial [Puccinia graminis f. sp. tritici CRL 75-36-700-3]
IISNALKVASTKNPLVELAPESSGRMEASPFKQLHSCCENIALAITNSKDVSFASLASFMASGVCGVLFGPLQARYFPPTGAAQIINFSLPSENFWTHTQVLLHNRISEALKTPAALSPLPSSLLA